MYYWDLFLFVSALRFFTEGGSYTYIRRFGVAVSFHYNVRRVSRRIYFCEKTPEQAGLLVPGGMFLVLGCLFCFETATGWTYSGMTWPVYIWAPALGLFELWYFGGRKIGVLIPAFILTAAGALSFAGMLMTGLWPL